MHWLWSNLRLNQGLNWGINPSQGKNNDRQRHVVLLFGEILVDRFPDREVLGGAPFNVARHLRAFGCAPVLVTRIGQDAAGARVLQTLESSGLATHGVQLDTIYPTGMVDVNFTSEGHRFDIISDQAYDHIHPRLSRMAASPRIRNLSILEHWRSVRAHIEPAAFIACCWRSAFF